MQIPTELFPDLSGGRACPVLRVAFLHLSPVPGKLAHNRRLLETAIDVAAAASAGWIVTPELCTCGYSFADRLGTDWIQPQPDPWMAGLIRRTGRSGITLFLSHPEREASSNRLYNAVFVISGGAVVGRHRKINTLRTGSESWSTPGTEAVPVPAPPFSRVGILICGDAFSPGIAESLKNQGAEMLVSAAAWAPGFHGPNGEWERCSRDTGLPLLVCNRTGADRTVDFTDAESVVVKNGRRLLTFSSGTSSVVVFDWDLKTQALSSPAYETLPL
jgi:predicted amidohydrolase